jgi:hypothetical protein
MILLSHGQDMSVVHTFISKLLAYSLKLQHLDYGVNYCLRLSINVPTLDPCNTAIGLVLLLFRTSCAAKLFLVTKRCSLRVTSLPGLYLSPFITIVSKFPHRRHTMVAALSTASGAPIPKFSLPC